MQSSSTLDGNRIPLPRIFPDRCGVRRSKHLFAACDWILEDPMRRTFPSPLQPLRLHDLSLLVLR